MSLRIFKFLICFFFLWPSICCGFEEDLNPVESDVFNPPVGMEELEVTSGLRVIIPKGAKTRKVGASIIIEEDQEYFSRRFYEITGEIEGLKKTLEEMQDQIKALNQTIEKQEKSIKDQRELINQMPLFQQEIKE